MTMEQPGKEFVRFFIYGRAIGKAHLIICVLYNAEIIFNSDTTTPVKPILTGSGRINRVNNTPLT